MGCSGIYSPEEGGSYDRVFSDANEQMLAQRVSEFAKVEGREEWPKITDCDRLNTVFAALDKLGSVLSSHNAGYTCPDGNRMRLKCFLN
jgi:hypothetical protein